MTTQLHARSVQVKTNLAATSDTLVNRAAIEPRLDQETLRTTEHMRWHLLTDMQPHHAHDNEWERLGAPGTEKIRVNSLHAYTLPVVPSRSPAFPGAPWVLWRSSGFPGHYYYCY